MFSLLACLCLPFPTHQLPGGPLRYRLDLTLSQTADYSGMGGPIQETAALVSAFVVLVERDSAGLRFAEITFDSVKVAPNELLPGNLAGDVSGAKAVVYRAQLVKSRPLGGFKTTSVQAHANLFQSAFDALYPGFPATAKVGDRWTDTVGFKDTVPIEKETTNIVQWTATAVSNGVISLEGVTTGTTRTVQRSGDREMVANGIISGNRTMTIPAGAPALTGRIASKIDLTGSIVDVGTFPIKAENLLVITRLP